MKVPYQFEGGELNGLTLGVEHDRRIYFHVKEPPLHLRATEGQETRIETPDVETYIYDVHSGRFLEQSLATPEMQRWRFYSLRQSIADVLVAGGEGVLDMQERDVVRTFNAEIAAHTIEVMQRVGVNPDAISYLLQENTRLREQIARYPQRIVQMIELVMIDVETREDENEDVWIATPASELEAELIKAVREVEP